MRLDLNWDVEVLDNGVDAEGDAGKRPEIHHRCGQSICAFSSMVADDLGNQLDAPEYGADCAKDGGGEGDRCLGGHCEVWWKIFLYGTLLSMSSICIWSLQLISKMASCPHGDESI